MPEQPRRPDPPADPSRASLPALSGDPDSDAPRPGGGARVDAPAGEAIRGSTSLLFRDLGLGSTALASADPDREAATNLRLLQLDALERRSTPTETSVPGRDRRGHRSGSNLATITATDTEPERAARMADAFAQGYIALREETAAREIEQERKAVDDQLRRFRSRRGGPARAGTTQAPGRARAGAQRALKELTIAGVAPIGVRQVERAEVPSSAVSPDPLRNTVIGAILGLALGIGFAIWLERRDQRIRDAHDLEGAFGRRSSPGFPRAAGSPSRARGPALWRRRRRRPSARCGPIFGTSWKRGARDRCW